MAGDYADMFQRLFASHPEVELVLYDAVSGQLPSSPGECDAWITSGSRSSVNDDARWIRDLESFVRDVADEGVPFVGVCFGHQLLAKALGGTVVRASGGWGVGLKEVYLREGSALAAMNGGKARILNSHQDQVAVLPPGAEVLGWADHCPISLMSVGARMLGIQGHPEFQREYVETVLESRRGNVIPDEVAAAGLASLTVLPDTAMLADWIVGFVTAP